MVTEEVVAGGDRRLVMARLRMGSLHAAIKILMDDKIKRLEAKKEFTELFESTYQK